MSPGIAAAGGSGSATWMASASCSWTVKREAANGATTAMTRLYGWGPRGERLVDAVPAGHWKTTTFVAGLRRDGVIAPCVLDGPMTGEIFRAYVEQMLAPSLRRGDVVVLDNLPAHKVAGVKEAITAADASLLYPGFLTRGPG